jgi:hypothetical protein
MPKSSPDPKSRAVPGLVWIALGLLLLASFGLDLRNTLAGGAIDLRNRITGARLLASHLDPYFYKWQEPEPPEFADPYNNPLLPVSKTTATPALLVAQMPFALLPYRLAQLAWFFAQWLLLLGTAAIWWRECATQRQRLLLAVFVTGFTYTAAWRLHAERGQSYVLLTFLFAVWLAPTLEARQKSGWLAGLCAGLLAALRPPFLLLAPFLVLHRRRQWPGAIAGLLLGLLLPLCFRTDAWHQYAAAMDLHSYFYRNAIDPEPPHETFPPAIEGMPTDLLANYAPIPYADFSLHGALARLGWEPFPEWPPLVLVIAGYLAWLWFSRRGEGTRLLLSVACWLFLADLCLPAYRNIYNDLYVLNVIILGLLAAGTGPLPWGARLCFLALPLGWAMAWFAPRRDLLTDLPSLVLTLGVALLLFWFNFPANPRKVNAPC